jgi:hypothetical protein
MPFSPPRFLLDDPIWRACVFFFYSDLARLTRAPPRSQDLQAEPAPPKTPRPLRSNSTTRRAAKVRRTDEDDLYYMGTEDSAPKVS